MDIRSVMTPNPVVCNPDTNLQQVARLMLENDCGQIPVVDSGGRPVGVITDRDIAVRAVAEGTDPRDAAAGDFMSAPVATISEKSDINECFRLMEEKKIRRVVVVDERGSVAGIIAQADIALSGHRGETSEIVKEVSKPGQSRQ